MKRNSHLLVGISSAYLLGLPLLPAVIGSLLPDIDLRLRGCKFKWKLLCNHRGITHHLFWVPFFLVLWKVSENPLLRSFIVGYLSHLIADMLTPRGIPFWQYGNRLSFSLFKTGSPQEYIAVGIYTLTTFVILAVKGPFALIPPEVYLLFKSLWKF